MNDRIVVAEFVVAVPSVFVMPDSPEHHEVLLGRTGRIEVIIIVGFMVPGDDPDLGPGQVTIVFIVMGNRPFG